MTSMDYESSKKRLHIIATHVGVVNRGAETFAIEIAKSLRDKYQVCIFTRGVVKECEDMVCTVTCNKGLVIRLAQCLIENVPLYKRFVRRVPYFNPEFILQFKFSILVALKICQLDKHKGAIYFPNNGLAGALIFGTLAKLTKSKWLYTGHGGIGKEEEKIIKAHPHAYVALTKQNYKWACSLSSGLVSSIANGIDVKRFQPPFKHYNSKVRKVVISVAALEGFKRHHLTIQAVSMIPDIELKIYGRGSLHDELMSLGSQLLPGRFSIEEVNYADIHHVYATADLFVLPSINEPFGIVYLEAMASGVGVVAQHDESRAEVVGEAGILIDCANLVAYSTAIEQALMRTWSHLARKQSLKFSWDAVGEEYHKLMGSLCEGKDE